MALIMYVLVFHPLTQYRSRRILCTTRFPCSGDEQPVFTTQLYHRSNMLFLRSGNIMFDWKEFVM